MRHEYIMESFKLNEDFAANRAKSLFRAKSRRRRLRRKQKNHKGRKSRTRSRSKRYNIEGSTTYAKAT